MKLVSTVKAEKGIRKKIEGIKRKKIISKKVVSLNDFRELKKTIDNRRILVVDDDEVMRSGLKRILENENFKVIVAEDGVELSKVLESSRFDLILLDVNLPWVDGFELCKVVKDHYALKSTPVILVSARKSEEDIQKGFDAGANDYITKPFEVDYIIEAINKVFKADGF